MGAATYTQLGRTMEGTKTYQIHSDAVTLAEARSNQKWRVTAIELEKESFAAVSVTIGHSEPNKAKLGRATGAGAPTLYHTQGTMGNDFSKSEA